MTARTGMTAIIADLRRMTNAGTADYSIAGSAYWSDDQLQDILDNNREDFFFREMTAIPQVAQAGVFNWFVYTLPFQNIEAGTASFSIQDINAGTVTASTYTLNARRGTVTFNANTVGAPYWANGSAYDLNGAAADVWEAKASFYADNFDFSTDNHSVKKSSLQDQALKQAAKYRAQSDKAVNMVCAERGDQC